MCQEYSSKSGLCSQIFFIFPRKIAENRKSLRKRLYNRKNNVQRQKPGCRAAKRKMAKRVPETYCRALLGQTRPTNLPMWELSSEVDRPPIEGSRARRPPPTKVVWPAQHSARGAATIAGAVSRKPARHHVRRRRQRWRLPSPRRASRAQPGCCATSPFSPPSSMAASPSGW